MLVTTTHDGALRRRLESDLKQVGRLFAQELQSDLDCVNRLAEHVQRYHGKMLRPMLVLATAMATDPQRDQTAQKHLVAAAVVEMVHMATLVHDDVLDEARMRRKGPTINQLQGNEAAVMLGDYLISHAYHLCSTLGSTEVSRAIAQATNTVCEGELLQLSHRHDLDLDEPTYFNIITRKTASLSGACCRVACMLSDCEQDVTDALYAYGERLGIAFQIIDDVLDLTGDPDTVGKTLGQDLAKGKLTLPLIHALGNAEPSRRRELIGLLGSHADASLSARPAAAGTQGVGELLRTCRSLEYAREKAASLVQQAKADLLAHLRETPARAYLLDLADTVVHRRL